MTEITVLDYVARTGDLLRASPDDLERFYEDLEDALDETLPVAQVAGFIQAITQLQRCAPGIAGCFRQNAQRILADRGNTTPPDITLRNLIVAGEGDLMCICAGDPPGPKIEQGYHRAGKKGGGYDAGASIKMFRPAFMRPKRKEDSDIRDEEGVKIVVNHLTRYISVDGSVRVAVANSELMVVALRVFPPREQWLMAARICDKVVGESVSFPVSPSNVVNLCADIMTYLYAKALYGALVDACAPLWYDYAAKHWYDLTAKSETPAGDLVTALREKVWPDNAPPQPTAGDDPSAFMSLVGGVFGNVSRYFPNYLDELYANGLTSAYLHSIYLGVDDEMTRALFDAAAAELRIRTDMALATHVAAEQRAKFVLRLGILRKIMSPSRYAVVSKVENETTLSQTLTKSEKEQLNAEYEAERAYITAAMNNKCPHIPLYRTFRRAKTVADMRTAWQALSQYVPKEESSTMIACKKCKYPLICPHYLTYIRLVVNDASPRDIHDALFKYIIAGSDPDAQKCRICYEIMFSRYEFGEDVKSPEDYDDDLRKMVYVETSQLLTLVKSTKPTDMRTLLFQVRDVVYPYAVLIDAELKQTRNYSTTDASARRNVFIAIIAAAKLVQLVAKYPNLYFASAPKLRKLPDLIEFIAGALMTIKTIALREIPGITRTVVRDRIALGVSAFGSTVGVVPEDEQTETPEMFEKRIRTDPTYYWIAEAIGRNPNDFAAVMGASPAKIQKQRFVYQHAYGMKLTYTNADLAAAYNAWMAHVRATASGEPKILLGDGICDATGYTASPWNRGPAFFAHSGMNSQVDGDIRFNGVVSQLGCVYDEAGLLHKFTLYQIGNSAYSAVQITAWTAAERKEKAPNGIRAAIKDRVCATCGVRKSLAHKLDASRIKASIAALTDVAAFYRFYEHRCLKDGIHEYDDNSHKCRKCGIDGSISMSSADAMNYYRENVDVYRAATALSTAATSIQPLPPAAPAQPKQYTWTERFADIVAVANIGGVHPRMIQYIGAYEGNSIEAITSGTYTPPITTSRDDTRVYIWKGIVMSMIAAWLRIRNYNQGKKHSEYTMHVVGKTPRELLAGLPDVGGEFMDLFEWAYWNEKPEKILSLCAQEWCSCLLKIYEHDDDATQDLRHEFVKTQISSTIASQELFSERNPFNWSIVYGNKDAPDTGVENFDPDQEDSVIRDKSFSIDAFDMDEGARDNLSPT